MTTPQAVHHSLLRPCVLHILRAAGYHSTRPSVLDTLTDIAGRYMLLLATSTSNHASLGHNELDLSIEDVRMAMQDCGVLLPEKVLEDQIYEGEEDTRGVDAFLEWVMGPENREIRRVALEGGDEGKEDYLTSLKKKYDKTEDESRYQGTLLGNTLELRAVPVEGGELKSMKEWAERRKTLSRPQTGSTSTSRRQSSDLSSLEDQDMEGMEF